MGNKTNNVVYEKALDFAVRIIRLCKYLNEQKSEYVMSKQLLRCGTSIGANIAETIEAISSKEFESKVYIALKEARETEYWLLLFSRSGYLNADEYSSINDDCSELLKLLTSITKTIRTKNQK